jgi:hypothetical protein
MNNNKLKNTLNKINELKKTINNAPNNLENKTTNIIKKIPPIKNILFYLFLLIIVCLIIYLVICLIHYYNKNCFEKKSFIHYLTDFTDENPCTLEDDPSNKSESSTHIPFIPSSEVFHISNQIFSFEDAKCKCASYDSRLAKKAEIIDAYNKGTTWGNSYGWAEDSNAYFVVQKCDYDKCMEENERLPENKKKFCGKPGINGGKFPNAELKFGALCYGIKPKVTSVKEKEAYCPPMNYCKLKSFTKDDSDVIF